MKVYNQSIKVSKFHNKCEFHVLDWKSVGFYFPESLNNCKYFDIRSFQNIQVDSKKALIQIHVWKVYILINTVRTNTARRFHKILRTTNLVGGKCWVLKKTII